MAVCANAVITAGGRIDGAFAAAAGTSIKALAPLHGTTSLARVIAAARGAGAQRIAVVGDAAVRDACEHDVDRVIADTGSGEGNVVAALRAWPQDEPLLYLTSDMPYIQAVHIVGLMDCIKENTFAMPVVSLAQYRQRFPDAPPAGIALRDGAIVNGGLFVMPAGASSHIEAVAMRFFAARKSPLAMARLVGLPFLVSYLFRRLTLAGIEGRAQSILRMPVMALRDAAAELAFDIDDASHYAYACAHK